jgi:hypothetical protein
VLLSAVIAVGTVVITSADRPPTLAPGGRVGQN